MWETKSQEEAQDVAFHVVDAKQAEREARVIRFDEESLFTTYRDDQSVMVVTEYCTRRVPSTDSATDTDDGSVLEPSAGGRVRRSRWL
jgi:hypothetical protein